MDNIYYPGEQGLHDHVLYGVVSIIRNSNIGTRDQYGHFIFSDVSDNSASIRTGYGFLCRVSVAVQ
jgi:hypothetical protein